MPSEKIFGSDCVDVRVAWGTNQEGQIQVATTAANSDDPHQATDRLIEIVNQWLVDAGEPTIDMDKVRASLQYAPSFDGWHATLKDWESVNKLVKVLKRARDRQFGDPA